MNKRVMCLVLVLIMTVSICGCGSNTDVTTNQEGRTDTEATTSNESGTETEATTNNESGTDTEAATNNEGGTETEDATNYASGNPWINSDIEENVKENYDIELKDDFALAVNKDWVLNNSLGAGETKKDYLSSFEGKLQDRLMGIVTDASYENDHNAELVSTYYNAFLNWEARDAAGVKPLMPYLEDIKNINSLEDLYAYSTKTDLAFIDIYEWGTSVSPEDSTRQIVFLTSPDIFLTDRADYEHLDELDSYTQLVDKCRKATVKAVLIKCGYSDREIDDIYAGAIQFEKYFSQYCYTNDEMYLTDTTDIINKQLYTTDEMAKFEGAQVYLDKLNKLGLTEIPQIKLEEKIDFFQHLNDIYSEDNLEIIKDYLIAHTAAKAIGKLDKELYYQYLDIVNELGGGTGYKPEEEVAITNTSNYLGWPLSKLYCDKYVTEEDKQNISSVISKTIDEYKVMISEEAFLSETTKANAINKLDNMVIKCMYPDEWYDYSGLELTGTFLDMCQESLQFDLMRAIDEFNESFDRENWSFTPITINACYMSSENSINILPGLIGDVLYNDDMRTEEVYAMIGVVIGHEISHGFDPNGAMYDEVGNYSDWWTQEDYEAFDKLTKKLVEYYDDITIWEGFNCNGELVKGEACADMAGVACMLRLAAKEENFDYDLFFKSYSKMWAANSSINMDYYIGEYDEHPVNYLRVNAVVAQFDEFYETYGIKEGDGMYIAPESRVKIW